MTKQRNRQTGQTARMATRMAHAERADTRRGGDTVEALAGQVLSVLAARAPDAPEARCDASRLIDAVRLDDDAARDRAVAALLEDGVSVEAIIDRHIPEAARRLGAAWCEDGMGFADVTIGTARLQALLRDLVRRAPAVHGDDPMPPQVLMIVREENFHTLGAMVATQQMRRRGIDVRVCIGQSDAEVLALVGTREFDMAMISLSGSERLDHLRKFVDKMRARAGGPIPIVVGGPTVGNDQGMALETGADFATADPEEALRRCGLKIPRQGAHALAPSG